MKYTQNCGQQLLLMPDRFSMQQWQGIGSSKFYVSVIFMTKLQAINGDHPTNWLQSEMYLKA
jgi:hypothetical protein